MKVARTVWSRGKLGDYFKKLPITIMGGGCVVGSSQVQLINGVTESIEDIVAEHNIVEIPCIDIETKKVVIGKITEYHDTGIQETIKVTLANGYEIIGTKDHPVITSNGSTKKSRLPHWDRLDSLTTESRVAIPRELSFFGTVNNKYARLLGMMIGDGSYSSNIYYSTQDEELLNYINIQGFLTKVRREYITKGGKTYKLLVFQEKRIKDILLNAKIYGQASLNKRLPFNYKEWDKESFQELIGGLFDTDGCFFIEENRRCRIEFGSICKEIVYAIQWILHKFGVHSWIQFRKNNGEDIICGKKVNCKTDFFVLRISDKESIENFYNNFKLLVKYKQDILKKGVEILSTHKYKIPKDLLDTDIRFSKVVKIESAGLQHVYDLTVNTHHSFIANGIFVHNTNAKLIQIGTPKTRNHFYDAIDGRESSEWAVIRRDWTRCPNLWALSSIMLPDHEDPNHEQLRPYSTFVLSLMPKSLKQEFFPTRPDVWQEGSMSVEDFKTQYMLEFVDGAGQFLTKDEIEKMKDGEFDWQEYGKIGETYVAGIDFAGSASQSSDYTHITVLRITPDNVKQKIYAEHMQSIPYPEQIQRIAQLFGGFHPRFRCKAIFADMTGVGLPVVQALRDEYGLLELQGIIFNASDTFFNSGMNMKNIMYATIKQEIDYDRFKYPKLDRFLESAGYEKNGFYFLMIGSWSDLECEQRLSVNKRIEASAGANDDVCSADVLANFAACVGQRRVAPRPSMGRFGGSFR